MKLILLTSLLAIASGANFMKGLCMKGACGDGKCHPGPEQNFSPTFWCSCPPYRRGDFCDVECSVNCSLTETCVLSPTGLERCQAKDSFIYGAQAKDQGSQCPDVCQNGGYCKDGNCVCPIGFNGTTCSEDIDECQLGKQCFNGNCINTYGSFKCECFENFAGRLCAWSGDDYEEEAELMDLVANTKVCTTLPQCVNSGACEKRFDGMEYCVCPNGYTGELCELDIDECQESPCQNGGTCSNNNGSFQCFCVNGFKGDNCEINIDDCIGNNCSAGSTCEDGIGRYTCRCPPGLTGHYCEKPNPCDAAPCQNGGQCTLNEDGGFSCSCSTGYKGILCSQDVDECEEGIAHCYHGGECVNTPGSYNCECRRGYNGSMCENAFNTCEAEKISCGSGECVMTSQREPVCQCKQGFFGARCDVQCPEGLGGYNCDISINEQMCGRGAEKQCENHGICSQKKCICQPDFVGDHCEIARKDAKIKNACMVNVCLNNGACLAGSDGESDVCLCEKTFTGITCEIPVDPCKNSPCYNGGHCLSDQQSRTARCICEEGFEGEFCEKKTQVDCSKMVCKNGGECEVVDGQSTCFCPTGFAGPTCEKLVPVNKFLTLDDALRDKCVERNCSARAGNGVCDEDCNHFVCDYDGGDCSATQRPFKKCMYEELCAHSFGNGKCDQVCNNVECLLDGLDCMPEVSTCPIYIRNHCSKRFADSICNEECNTEACGFDGGDCLVTIKPGDNVTTNVISDIRLTLMVSPETFVQNAPRFLMDVSRAVRMPVRIQTDSEGPLIFELIDDEVGERILVELRPINNTYKEASSRRIQKRQVAHRVGVVAWLEVDEQQSSNCHRTSSCLFSDAQSIVDFVSADIARQGKTDYFGGMPIAEAVVSPRTTTSTGFKWPNTLLMTAIGFVMIAMLIAAVIVSGEEKRNRKRRFVSAPVWMPPTEKQAEEMKRCSQSYNHYFDVKRGRFDIENGNAYTQLKSGYGNSINNNKSPVSTAYPTYAQVRSNEPTSRLLLEAAGQKRITVGSVTSETVNERDSKHRRSALHWLADNSSKKTEEDIYADAELLLKEGAEVNVLDNENETPLMLAVRARRTGLVKLFMKHGADPTIFNNSERTTLHVAVNNYDEKTLEVLLRYPSVVAEIDEIDHQGRTPLMEAARISAEVSLAQLLINHGAKIECDGNSRKESEKYKGRTALHYAAMNQNFDMVQYLVKLNANKDKQDEEGQTPLMLAALAGDARIVEFLIGEGASVDTTDQMDRNARQLAESVFHYAVVHVIDEAIKESRFINAHFSPDDTRKVPKSMAAGGKAKHTIKTMKKTVPRKGSATPQSVSADSAYNLTPPPSDGSITPPSYLPLSANTTSGSGSSSSGYHPISSPQYQGMTSLHYSNTSSSTNGDSSPDYKPQDPGPMLSGMQWSSSGYGMNHYTINQTTPNNVYSTQSVFGHDYKPYQNHQQYPEEAFNMT